MTYHFGPEQENAFNVARDELTTRFERTPAGRDLGWVAAGVMDFKWGYLDGALDRWTPEDIEEILLGLYPAKVIMDPEDLDLIPTGFASFLLFLGEEGIARPVEVGIAAEVVERLRPHFHAAAMDDTNWSVGKRLWSVAQSEGVEFGDPDAMQRFMEDFNQRPFEDRDAILGPPMMPAGLATPRDRIEPLPPIVLPPLDELEKAALATVWPERVRRLVDFILSEEVERTLAHARSAQIPVRESVERPDYVRSNFSPMAVDFRVVGADLPTRQEELKELFLD